MSLLDSMPHVCSIGRVTRQNDALGGNKFVVVTERTGVECWEQKAAASTVKLYEKRGIKVDTSIYFPSNPNLTEQHVILITSRFGVAEPNLDITDVSNSSVIEVESVSYPDASAGQGVLWRVEGCSDKGGNQE